MKRLISLTIILLAFLSQPTTILALTRDEIVRNARVTGGITTVGNIITVQIQLGGSQIVGNNASNSTSLQTIQEAVNRLNQLRDRLRLR